MIDINHELCSNLVFSVADEWLVTNGLGGYACGTVAGLLTRRYHGLLIAALHPPVGRTLLLTKLDETAHYFDSAFHLFCNRWASGVVEPDGYKYLERFHLEGTTPVWTYALGDAQLEKRVWMQPGENTTYIRYDLHRAMEPLDLRIKALVNYRDHHGTTSARDWHMQIDLVEDGLRLCRSGEKIPFYLLCDRAEITLSNTWNDDFYLSCEADRGLSAVEDHLSAAFFSATLSPGDSLVLVASTDPDTIMDGLDAYRERRLYESAVIEQSMLVEPTAWLRQLLLAADQFIVDRSLPGESNGRSIIAGYPWFGDWGRDTMISLPGLTLTTGRHGTARKILAGYAHYINQGMLPNHFPETGEEPAYNTVDATLWYFQAIYAYLAASDDDEFLRRVFPALTEIIAWYQRGTRYNIHLDPADGLIYAGETGVQLTWMDAKADDWVVTPRIGKPVEINALWYNALKIMIAFAEQLNQPSNAYAQLAERARVGFQRYWNEPLGYCYDVLDGPDGDDPSLRPNQLFAISLPYSPLSPPQQRGIVDICARHLLTSYGLRSLSTNDSAYVGRYGGDRRQRDGAYHQGTVWGWLIGPFISAHLRVYRDPNQARSYLSPLISQLSNHGLGSLSEIFDGDPPFSPNGCIAQAWSVAEVLRVWFDIEAFQAKSPDTPFAQQDIQPAAQ